ncbi:hypothetical protein DIPPA_12370 [Diplonema papillatum]|nr:hypothetical protein DIPPA_12370 [Diplonema papillatum]
MSSLSEVQGQLVRTVGRLRKRPGRPALRRRPRRASAPEMRQVPALSYEECLETVRTDAAPWHALLEYEGGFAPCPEVVVEHAVQGRRPSAEDWASLIKYMAIRCGREPHHYKSCADRVSDLLPRFDAYSTLLTSSFCGLCIYGRDAPAAVSILRNSPAFHPFPFAWVAFPQVLWTNEVEGQPLARLHLAAAKHYSRRTREQVPSVLLGVHALLQHAVVRDDQPLFWDVCRQLALWKDAQGTVPMLLPESVDLIALSASSMPNGDEDTQTAVKTLLTRAGAADLVQAFQHALDRVHKQPALLHA